MKLNEAVGLFLRRITRHRAFLPVSIFTVFLVILLISTTLSDRPPVIDSISPQVGYPGNVLMIKGDNFGDRRGSSSVVIAGVRPTSSAYLEWTNRRVSVRIPSEVDSGMVYVQRSNSTSNGKLFTNRNNIPVAVKTTTAPGEPHIARIDPSAGSVGTKMTITGENFGASRGTAKVLFTPIQVSDQGIQASDIVAKERFAGCQCDYNYVSWSHNQIVLHVPDGASSGNVSVVTDRGTSNSLYFEVTNPIGTKSYTNKRGYQIHFGVQVSHVESAAGGSIDLWLPNLSTTLSQRHVERIVEPKPATGDVNGLMRFELNGLKPDESYPVSVTYYFDRYSVETRIDPTKVTDGYDNSSRLYETYTSSNTLVPVDEPLVLSTAQQVIAQQRNPYQEARLLYNFVTQRLKYSQAATAGNVLSTLRSGVGDSYSLSLSYTALLRAAGIPARSVAGVLVFGDKQTINHYWTEFYLNGFGWVPVDPGLGAGARYGGFPSRSDAADYYFGNLDNQHITFTRGIVSVNKLDPQDKTVHRSRSYSFQEFDEESSPDVKAYDSTWDNVIVVDWW